MTPRRCGVCTGEPISRTRLFPRLFVAAYVRSALETDTEGRGSRWICRIDHPSREQLRYAQVSLVPSSLCCGCSRRAKWPLYSAQQRILWHDCRCPVSCGVVTQPWHCKWNWFSYLFGEPENAARPATFDLWLIYAGTDDRFRTIYGIHPILKGRGCTHTGYPE